MSDPLLVAPNGSITGSPIAIWHRVRNDHGIVDAHAGRHRRAS
ncbi:hypothetical protein [Nonlabens ponticola]|nr:hypothetical protein [Nonlabens ponticola]